MKKAVVVGGSNGIGLAITKEFIKKGYHVEIVDRQIPDKAADLSEKDYTFFHSDLREFNEELFDSLSGDMEVQLLMITAGFGRVADFEYLHLSEIDSLLKVNTISCIKIIRKFYERVKSSDTFYCGVMGSISGLVSSPMFSVYAASKAAICRFVESINIELEEAGVKNRILNVSPGSLKGTRFNGGMNNLEEIENVAKDVIEQLFSFSGIYIPEYNLTYKNVIERYHKDAHEFGISSYQYKKSSGRVLNEERVKIGYLSGTFDLFHIGHLNLLKRAKEQCDYLIVGVHPSGAHKGKETFIPFDERVEILKSIKYVDRVVESCPEDCDAWDLWRYNRLFVGSDYKGTERFNRYEEYFKDKNVEIVYFPYTQSTSSTQLRKAVEKV